MLVAVNRRDRLDVPADAKGDLPVGCAVASGATPGHDQVAILQERPHGCAPVACLSHGKLLDVVRRLVGHDRGERGVILIIELVRGNQVDPPSADVQVRAEHVRVDAPRESLAKHVGAVRAWQRNCRRNPYQPTIVRV